MPLGKAQEKIACPSCGCGHCPVTDTEVREVRAPALPGRKRINRKHVRRRRACRYCGWSFYTIETYEDPDLPDQALPPESPVTPLVGSGHDVGRPPDTSPKKVKRLAASRKSKPKNPYL